MDSYPKPTIKVPAFKEENGFYASPQRSTLMSKIKANNTNPERKLRKALWKIGLRYRINDKSLPGKPDLVLKKHKLVIFVDGDFWHGYNWEKKKKTIKSNRKYWIPKIERTIYRDKLNVKKLTAMGWTVIRFWDWQIRKELGNCIHEILDKITDSEKIY